MPHKKLLLFFSLSALLFLLALFAFLGWNTVAGSQTLEECRRDPVGENRENLSACIDLANATGDSRLQFRLGVTFANGEGVEQDFAKALEWFRHAATNGNPKAQNSLGLMYLNGVGVQTDFAEAFEWFQKAVRNGSVWAQNSLGLMYVNGAGVQRDPAKAFEWFSKGAELGHSEAQNNLGVMYLLGDGVQRDYVIAFMWHSLAAKQGNKLAIRNRTEILKRLTPAQITEGEQMTRDWMSAHSD